MSTASTPVNPAPTVYLRGRHFMLDLQAAQLFEVSPGDVRKAASLHPDRFADDWLIELTLEELDGLKASHPHLALDAGQHPAHLAFNEMGLCVLSFYLASDKAVAMSTAQVRAFGAVQQHAHNLKECGHQLQYLQNQLNQKFPDLGQALRYLLGFVPQGPRQPIGFRQGYRENNG